MVMPPTDRIAAGFLERVPMAQTLGLRIDDASPTRATVTLLDQAPFHNHIGGPHAGAMFTLAETASGVIVFVAFGAQLGRATPLAVRAEVDYRKLAMGDLVASAHLDQDPAGIIVALDAGERPEFDVKVDVCRGDGAVVAEVLICWTLRLNEAAAAAQ